MSKNYQDRHFASWLKNNIPRVKEQDSGQKDWSRALKWGIVRSCSSDTFGGTPKYVKLQVVQFLRFCKRILKSLNKNAKFAKTLKIDIFCS